MHLTLHLTKNCNMRCNYCYSPPVSGFEMDEETALQAIEFAAKGQNRNTGIVFFGGEPLLRENLIRKCIDHCLERNRSTPGLFHFKLSTNGLLLNTDFLEYAGQAHLSIALSIDGIQSAHDRHRKTTTGEGTFSEVIRKAQLLLKYQPYASALMTISPETVNCYSESVEFVESLGFKYMIVSLNYAGNWNDNDIRILQRQYRKLAEIYQQWIENEKKFYLSPFERVFASHIRGKEHTLCSHCALGLRQLSVAPDGKIFPCVQFVRDDSFSIGDVWNGINEEKRWKIHNSSKMHPRECTECELAGSCESHCSCLNWQTTGDISKVSPILCETEKILIPIVDKLGNRLFKNRSPMFIQKHYNTEYPFISLLEDAFNENN